LGDVPGGRLPRLDVALLELERVGADRLLVRRGVAAVREDDALVGDDHVAVLPGDLGELLLDRDAGLAPDLRHRILGDVELPDDQVSRHLLILRRYAAGRMFWLTWNRFSGSYCALIAASRAQL